MRRKTNKRASGAVSAPDMCVIGAGYVGLVTAACFAHLGKRVVLVEKQKNRVERLKRGLMPFYEPGLDRLVEKAISNRLLSFSTDIASAIQFARTVIVAVGTPTLKNGSVDMKDYWQVIEEIGCASSGRKVIVNKSTVPIGTAARALKHLSKYHTKAQFDLVSFPEFLREGNAIDDFLKPDRLVIGASSAHAEQIVKNLIKGIRTKKLFVSIETSEMIKYASNAFLATKISFINEIANVCETVGADVTDVAKGMGLDSRIGKYFLNAGVGYGGSCFPKDVKALRHIAGNHKYSFKLLKAVIEVNTNQRKRVLEKLQKHVGRLKGKTIAVLGLAFKNNTDDVRESASIDIIRELLNRGALVIAHDPIAEENARQVIEKEGQLVYCDSAEQAVIDSDAVVIATEWDQFKNLNWKKIKNSVRKPVIIDGRNILDKDHLKSLGFTYDAIGR